MFSLLTCGQGILNWNCMFSTNSLSLLWTLWATLTHSCQKDLTPGVCPWSLPWTLPLYSQPHWLLTPGPLSTSYFCLWSFGLSCHPCFLSVLFWFPLTNLLAHTAWKGKNATPVPTPRSQFLTMTPVQPHDSPKPIERLQSLCTPLGTLAFLILFTKHR